MSDFDASKIAKNVKKKVKKNLKKSKNRVNVEIGKSGSAFYFLGAVGSAIYFISTADGFWDGVLGVLKSLVWPAFLIFEALSALGA
ncbi:MAG: hypothetical protein RIR24_350 [Actinomycetota bacterium]|jgi:ADP-ribosylglycohydrolase